MSDAWADVAGRMELDLAVALQGIGAPGLTGPLVLTVRRSLYNHVREAFARPDCTPEIRDWVRAHLTGRPDSPPQGT